MLYVYRDSGYAMVQYDKIELGNSSIAETSSAWVELSGQTGAIKASGALNIGGSAVISGNLAVSGTINGRKWYWSGQGGQPSWLWGGNDGANMYVYNPSNFSVNYATTSGATNDGRLYGIYKIRVGTRVLDSSTGTGTSRVLCTINDVRNWTGNPNVDPNSVVIVVMNGDAVANGCHPHCVSYAYQSGNYFVLFKDAIGTGPCRINFAMIYGY